MNDLSRARFALAIDAMGGDQAPDMVIEGLELAAERHPEARFLLIGDEAKLTALLQSKRRARAAGGGGRRRGAGGGGER